MNHTAESDDHLTIEEESSADALGVTLSLADTPEEDADRYQDVIRGLKEFEESGEGGAAEAFSTAEGAHDLDVRPETTVA